MEELFQYKYRISSLRLGNWDYSAPGYYFITICTKEGENYFGEVENGKVKLTKIGEVAQKEILKTGKIRKNVRIDEFVVMPNHIHAIIIIENVETQSIASVHSRRNENTFGPQSNNLSSIVRGIKIAVKSYAVKNKIEFAWQPRFYDHIIRNEDSLNKIREYIKNNPLKWVSDRNYEIFK